MEGCLLGLNEKGQSERQTELAPTDNFDDSGDVGGNEAFEASEVLEVVSLRPGEGSERHAREKRTPRTACHGPVLRDQKACRRCRIEGWKSAASR